MSSQQKLQTLRTLMQQQNIDYYFVPSRDAHNSEYVPDAWQRRSWISEFTGSAGEALIGLDKAYLWTDPRYFLQAEKELDSKSWQLMKQQQGMAPPIDAWLREHAVGKRVAVDPTLISIQAAQKWIFALNEGQGEVVLLTDNLVDEAWQDQPVINGHPLSLYPEKYAGETAKEKIAQLRAKLKEKHCDAHVVTVLDAIAWIFNIRGKDIEYNPLVISYAIITQAEAILFVDLTKVNDHDRAYLKAQGINIQPYETFESALQKLSGKVLLDAASDSMWIFKALQSKVELGESPITDMKACKNKAEREGMQVAHHKDGVALVKFMAWLEKNWQGQSEMSVSDRLEAFRREDDHCLGLSFTTISGMAEHGAIVHYRVTKQTDKPLSDDSLFLVDSGGQYWEGTTDITRTLHFGTPTKEQQRHYTLVLKGHLALGHVVFPDGTMGVHLDALARQYLWEDALDFGHGTGHGVGCYLCVHEAPQRISPGLIPVALKPGMMVSNEPGVYLEGQYGIRIENVCMIDQAKVAASATGHGPFYQLKDLTLVPYSRKLIDKSLLTDQEIKWVNDYHQRVRETLSQDLSTELKTWLDEKTKPL